MIARIADRLKSARRRQFVGRERERGMFRAALLAHELPFQLLYIYGPGGIGKTTLLTEYAALCEENNHTAIYLDCRALRPTAESFLAALRGAMSLGANDSPIRALSNLNGHPTLLLDTYENICAVDEWLRDQFLPELGDNVLVVIAARDAPSPAWLADPGWQTLIRSHPLRNLSPDESRAFLSRRNIPDEQHAHVLDFTHGHPLALSLVADLFAARPDTRFRPERAPDTVKLLLERLVSKVPSPAHRAALEVCGLVRVATESLLSETLSMPNAHELFEWLHGLSFIETDPHGLTPHDLAREILVADLRWRNPDWYAELHKRIRNYYSKRVQQTHATDQERVLADYIFLHRDNPVVRPYFDLLASKNSAGASTDLPRAGELEDLIEMVAKNEGDESARLAANWLASQPQGVVVYRDGEGKPSGLLVQIALERATRAEIDSDPGTRAAWEYLEKYAPLRAGERATMFRFWMARDSYQNVSSTQSVIFVNMVQHYLATPGLAFTILPCADPGFWEPVFGYADLQRLREADFAVSEKKFGVYGHDWRKVPPMNWLNLLAEREVAFTPLPTQPPSIVETLVVLSQPEFFEAIRAALRDWAAADELRDNPLLKSRLVVERAGVGSSVNDRIAALKDLVRQTCEGLQSTPRDAKLYRALFHTYLQPAPSQEQAAELMDLPFSTYRRHLKAGITRMAESLWQIEIGR